MDLTVCRNSVCQLNNNHSGRINARLNRIIIVHIDYNRVSIVNLLTSVRARNFQMNFMSSNNCY